MKAISTGSIFEIFDDSLLTYDHLPPQTYVVRFDKHRGFFLERYVDIEIKEEKVYGVHLAKIEKVLSAFDESERSLGIILSGDKGIGKSLFAKLLAQQGIDRGLPLIVVDNYIPGIASYLETIDQQCIVLFDEYDKTFGEIKAPDGAPNPQTELLGLFDGVSGGKRLYVIICNNINRISELLVNRPGRFHYHFRFEYPSPDEVREYLSDKLKSEYHGEIDAVIGFSKKISINYDCLRAIAFEINLGSTFKQAVQDLNIVNLEPERYSVVLRYKDGTVLSNRNCSLDLFGTDTLSVYWLEDLRGNELGTIHFIPQDCVYDAQRFATIVPGEAIDVEYSSDESDATTVARLKEVGVDCAVLTRKVEKSLHYAV